MLSLENSLDGTTNQLAEISRHNPKSQVFATGLGRSKTHDGSSLSDVPTTNTDAAECTTENEILN